MKTRFAGAVLAAAITVTALAGSAQAGDWPTLGPDGYKGVKLGASEQQAVATGLLVDGEGDQTCRRYYFAPSEGTMPRASGVWISGTRGVTVIGGTSRMLTAQGIGRGASLRALKQRYPVLTQDAQFDWIYSAPVPGNENAKYRFVVLNDVVDDFAIESNDRAGC
jgi:hypothetical protein